ncbi:MAG TPA: DNA-binding response regulator [Coxiellaceae bacterium]|nr:DNA-binding response regulator [Coxiellaceae bacterium]
MQLKSTHYTTAEAFLNDTPQKITCIICDIRLPGMSGLQLQQQLKANNMNTPLVFVSGHADVRMAVKSIQDGAKDFLTKPINNQELLDTVFSILKTEHNQKHKQTLQANFKKQIDSLTSRELSILKLIAKGQSSKTIADELSISKNTVEVHRANLMQKMGVNSSSQLVAQAVAFGIVDVDF